MIIDVEVLSHIDIALWAQPTTSKVIIVNAVTGRPVYIWRDSRRKNCTSVVEFSSDGHTLATGVDFKGEVLLHNIQHIYSVNVKVRTWMYVCACVRVCGHDVQLRT